MPPRRPLATCALAALATCAGRVSAQAPPPAPTCSSSDTLRWRLPAAPASCGAALAVTALGSATADGPFAPLTEGTRLRDATGLDTAYVLTPGERRGIGAFRLRVAYAGCGESAPGPVAPVGELPTTPITAVDHTAAGVLLSWEAPPADPRVAAYPVYEQTGRAPLATVAGLTFLAPAPDDPTAPTAYFLGTADACNSTSLSPELYSAAAADVERDACARTLTLARRLAADWPRPFARAEVVYLHAGGADTVVVEGEGGEITVPDPFPGEAYELRVSYVDALGARTTSLPQRLEPAPVLTSDTVEVARLSFANGDWVAAWRWSPEAAYADGSWRVERDGEVAAGGPLDGGLGATGEPSIALGLGGDFDWAGATLLAGATDLCGVARESPPARPVIAAAELATGSAVRLTWTAPRPAGLAVAGYAIERLGEDGAYGAVGSAPPHGRTFVDDLSRSARRELCYRVIAEVALADTLGRGRAVERWASAPVCVEREPRVLLPTGFAPEGGVSPTYRPRLGLVDGLGYRLRVYDRWGTLLYDGDDPAAGWDGTAPGGRAVPPGVYVALVELTDADGAVERFDAAVALVR